MKQSGNNLLDSTSLSVTLTKLVEKPANGKTRIDDLVESFHENGFVLALIVFSLPIAIPLPYPPGFTTIVGTPLIILSIQMILCYKKVRLPERINRYEIKNSTLIMIGNKVIPILKYVEKYIKPRFKFANSFYAEQLIGFVSLIASLSIAIPLPFTNSVPALGIGVMSLGLLNRDGLIIIAGFIITIIGLVIAATAIITGFIWLKYAINYIQYLTIKIFK